VKFCEVAEGEVVVYRLIWFKVRLCKFAENEPFVMSTQGHAFVGFM